MRRFLQTDKSIERRIRSGHGTGTGRNYTPWLEVHNGPTRGISSRILGHKTGRIHHLFSQLELYYFLEAEWMDCIIDIREQYPLLPRAETETISSYLGIRHPRIPRTKTHPVMTTDFLLTTQDGMLHARSLKYYSDLSNPRTVEKLKIEKEYWNRRNIEWKIVTERQINKVHAKNISWFRSWKDSKWLTPEAQNTIEIAKDYLVDCLTSEALSSPAQICSEFDRMNHLLTGSCLSILAHLIANRRLHIDLTTHLINQMN